MKDLLKLIKEKRSERSLYDPEKPIPKDDLYKVLEAESWAPHSP